MGKSVIPRASKKQIEEELEVSKACLEDHHYQAQELTGRTSVAEDEFTRVHDYFQKDEC